MAQPDIVLYESIPFSFSQNFHGDERPYRTEALLYKAADSFSTGTNAICTDDKLFNIDGNGSLVAHMLYGPQQVIVVAGANKLVDTVENTIYRVRQVAAPLDAKRLNKNTLIEGNYGY